MQLRLLKLESADTDDECELVISSDEYSDGECNSKLNSSEPMLEAFKSDEDREHSYLYDVVTNSNAHPHNNEVFEQLEKKYSKLSSWPRSERKLLFDLINSSMLDPQSMKLNQSCPENIAEEIWQFVVKQRVEEVGKMTKTGAKPITSFSPLEEAVSVKRRISGLGNESQKIKRMELVDKITFALIPALILTSKGSLTTSILVVSVYWQVYGFFKEIFLDYVHQEVTRKRVLIYFQILLLILAKDTFLNFGLV